MMDKSSGARDLSAKLSTFIAVLSGAIGPGSGRPSYLLQRASRRRSVVCGAAMGNVTAAGLRSLAWLASVQSSAEGYFAPIGSNGFYERGGPRAAFDQQPVEAHAMVSACLESRRVTGDAQWMERARLAFSWFFGQNQLQEWLYDPTTGGCRDGLHSDRVNENQGAESTLSFLLALCEMRFADRRDVERSVEGKSGRPS